MKTARALLGYWQHGRWGHGGGRQQLLIVALASSLVGCGRSAVPLGSPVGALPEEGTNGQAGSQATPAAGAPSVDSGAPPDECQPMLELSFEPTARAQLAIWLESGDGSRFQTLLLTEAVSVHGIGNRPGALQMNSGYRWPYGRRETVLPHWASRRLASGAQPFRRVVFQDRPEGFANRSSNDQSPDPYFCLAFDRSLSQRDGLDAVSCASPFSSDKGRYLGLDEQGYAQPVQIAGMGLMQTLDPFTPYPPRRDVRPCTGPNCFDHEDLANYDSDAQQAMPEIDEVSAATLAMTQQTLRFEIDGRWLQQPLAVCAEINTEGDYNDYFNPDGHPTPTLPESEWDTWAASYGYPYVGQPSVVFCLEVSGIDSPVVALAPIGYSLSADGELGSALDGVLTDDPQGAPGSGADRLLAGDDGVRLRGVVTDPCASLPL